MNHLLRAAASKREGLLHRIVYSSTLVAADEAQAEQYLARIIASALKNNRLQNISGMLYYDREAQGVVQVLEGPKKDVVALFRIISSDARHRDCRVLREERVGSRLHAGFGMSLQRVTASTRAKLSDDAARHGAPGGGEELHQLRLQYTSTLLAADADEGWRTLGTILESAVPNNSRLRIGGLLTFNPSTFGVTQMLEGPAPAVLAVSDLISTDPRHRDVQLTNHELVLSAADIHFDAQWGMMQAETSEIELLDLAHRLRCAFAPYADLAERARIDGDPQLPPGGGSFASAVAAFAFASAVAAANASGRRRSHCQSQIDAAVGGGRAATFQRSVDETPELSKIM